MVRKRAVPLTAVTAESTAAMFDRGVFTGAGVQDAIAAFGFVIVQRRVGEVDVTTGDDLTVLVGDPRLRTSITGDLQIATDPDHGRRATDNYTATGGSGEVVLGVVLEKIALTVRTAQKTKTESRPYALTHQIGRVGPRHLDTLHAERRFRNVGDTQMRVAVVDSRRFTKASRITSIVAESLLRRSAYPVVVKRFCPVDGSLVG